LPELLRSRAAGWPGSKVYYLWVPEMKANEVVSLALVESSRSLQIGHFDAFIPQEDPNVDKKANDEFVEEEPTVSFIDNELKKQNICR